ncbi:hypothetical protein CSA37_00060 [Candidatus Fermentibacteria bacterium]|nr:MAG: hypothetical protein CSA37_00060 [Candidatus Fermentibacteria bacterium]
MIISAIALSALTAFNGSVSLGGLFTSGNSDVEQLDAGLQLSGQPTEVLETGFSFLASYGSKEDDVYIENYLSDATLKYNFSEKNYIASRVYWTKDEFAGISHEFGGTAGYGRELVSAETFTASLEAGGGYMSRENTIEEELSTATWYSGIKANWQATEAWTVTESAIIRGDFDNSENYYVGNLLEASSAITGNLSFITGFQLDYYNLPPVEGNENTDTALRVQLRYSL